MPDAVHPRGLSDVAGHPPARVTLPSGSHAVERDGDDPIIRGVTERDVRALAAAYGAAVEDLTVSGTCEVVKSDGDVCGRERPCPYHD